VASAVDERGRVYLVDEIGDLYYDSGNPEVGMYMVGGAAARWRSGGAAGGRQSMAGGGMWPAQGPGA
jgi:hypothetical protein